MTQSKRSVLAQWAVPLLCVALLGFGAYATVKLIDTTSGESFGVTATGAILLLIWVFILALCYQSFSAILLLSARRWMRANESSSSDFIDSKSLARTKLVMDLVFGTALVLSVAVVALRLLGLPK